MARVLTWLLLLANALGLAWNFGLGAALGLGQQAQREPQRLVQQVAANQVQLLSDVQAARVLARAKTAAQQADAAPPNCWVSAVLDDGQWAAVQPLLKAQWAPDQVQEEAASLPGRWLIYMGRFANAADMAKKRAQLTALGLVADAARSPALVPGLTLGTYPSPEQADQALAALAARGVRTARVVQELAPARARRLRLSAVTPQQQPNLANLRAALPGKTLAPCGGG
jgi:hypothetical protein